jgi:hypothetical protein
MSRTQIVHRIVKERPEIRRELQAEIRRHLNERYVWD